MKIKVLSQSMRWSFLVLTPVCIFLGWSTVVANERSVDLTLLMLALLGGVLAHISVNTLNEYFDFKSGLDFKTTKTKFSGGSGALPQNPEMASAVLSVGVVSFTATLLIGLFFVWESGLEILPLGIVGLVLIVTYTGWLNKFPFLCLIAPGVGFGILMVVGTQFVLGREYSTLSWMAAVVPFFLVNNLLLLNQYPDIKADTEVGRHHLPIVYGTTIGNRVYNSFAVAAIVVIISSVLVGYFPVLSLIALLPMPLAFFASSGALKYGEAIGNYPQYLSANVAVALLTPLLLGVSIMIG